MKNFHLLLLIVLAFVSCISVDKDEDRLNFKYSFDLVGEEILKDAIGISSIHAIDKYLVASTMNQDYFFTIYSLDSLNALGNLVEKGSGPNQFPTIALYDYATSFNKSNYFWTHDLNYPIFSKVNIEKSLKDGKTIIEDTIKLPFEDSFVTAFHISEDKVIGRSGNTVPSMGRLKLYNPKLKEVTKSVPLFPEVETSRKDLDFVTSKLNFIYVSALTLKPDGTKLASAMTCFNQIDIFNTDAELILSIKDDFSSGEERIKAYLKDDNLNFKHLNNYYGGICATDKFIFALFKNQLYEDYGEKMIPVSIRVFDWEGNPIAELNIPDYLYSITIDERNGYLIGFSYFEEKILRYDINDLLSDNI